MSESIPQTAYGVNRPVSEIVEMLRSLPGRFVAVAEGIRGPMIHFACAALDHVPGIVAMAERFVREHKDHFADGLQASGDGMSYVDDIERRRNERIRKALKRAAQDAVRELRQCLPVARWFTERSREANRG